MVAAFWLDLLANAVGGLVGGAVVFLLIERRLHFREERAARKKTSAVVLRALADELAYNARVAGALREHLPTGALPSIRFELGGWELVSQVPAFTALEPETVKALLDAYIRTRAAAEHHVLLFDLTYGSTGAVSFLIAATASTEQGRASFQSLEERRNGLRQRLIKRVADLEPYLETALGEVRGELRAHPEWRALADDGKPSLDARNRAAAV